MKPLSLQFSYRDTAPLIALSFMMTLLATAHLSGGADDAMTTAVITFCALLILAGFMLACQLNVPAKHPLWLFLIVAVWALTGLAGNHHQARIELLQLFGGLAIWSTGYIAGRIRNAVKFVWAAMLAISAILSLIALLSHTIVASLPAETTSIGVARMKLFFNSSNTFASLQGVFTILALYHLIYLFRYHTPTDVPLLSRITRLPRTGLISVSALILSLSCLLLTVSRAGISLTCLCIAMIVLLELRRYLLRHPSGMPRIVYRLPLLAGVLLPVLIVASLALSSGPIASRASDVGADTAGRIEIFGYYWNAWLAEPVTGHGLGSFNRVNESITTLDNASLLVLLGAAHNVVLQWLIQTGLVGLTGMLAIWAWMIWTASKALRSGRGGVTSVFVKAVMVCSVFLALHGLVDYALEVPSIMWTYAFLLGIACGIGSGTGMVQQDNL